MGLQLPAAQAGWLTGVGASATVTERFRLRAPRTLVRRDTLAGWGRTITAPRLTCDDGLGMSGETRGSLRGSDVKRGDLVTWDRARAADPLSILAGQDAIRRVDLVPIRYGRMAASPWSFYRGAAAVMAADLASRPDTGLTVQLCGDAHLLNFGLWATPERQLSFDLRDFDETLPGPFEWDVSRLVASVVVLARENGLKESVGRTRRLRTVCAPTVSASPSTRARRRSRSGTTSSPPTS